MSAHMKEPWMVWGRHILVADWSSIDGYSGIETWCNHAIADIDQGPNRGYDNANAARIVACVNGCKGINPEAVPDLLSVLNEAATMIEGMVADLCPRGDKAAEAMTRRVRAAIAKAQKGEKP